MTTPDLFAPQPDTLTGSLDWSEITITRTGVRYRWRVIPGTPMYDPERPPEGFVLEYWARSIPGTGQPGWTAAHFYPRRLEVWMELRKRRAIR